VADIVDKASRSRMMARIRGRDTRPELAVRCHLHASGFRYRLHVADLPGKPDIVLPKYRTALFVHGCFWHQHAGCKYAYRPKSNVEFWTSKLTENVKRDVRDQRLLGAAGWHVIVVWECQVGDPVFLEKLSDRIVGRSE
jgi:DNA mismatch endonuclease, patch repair protein